MNYEIKIRSIKNGQIAVADTVRTGGPRKVATY